MNIKIINILKEIDKKELDALLVSNPDNITYLLGFRPADGFLLINRKHITYFTNFIYSQEAKRIKEWKVKLINNNCFQRITNYIDTLKLKSVGFEGKHLSFLEYKNFKELLLRKHIKFSLTSNIIENMRTIKSVKELSLIKKAIGLSSEAFEFAKEITHQDMSEKDLSVELERFLKLRSGSTLAFPPVVAFGANTALPHHIPGKLRLYKSRFSLIDLGSRYYGYCADLTRVFFLGKMPTYLKNIYDIVRKAGSLAIKKIKDGVKAKDVDRAAREFIDKKGFGKYFGHGLGHGIGICVHENPYLNPHNDATLKENMVITIEPAIYIPGKFGVRIEDVLLVRSKKGEVLSGNINH